MMGYRRLCDIECADDIDSHVQDAAKELIEF